MTEKIVKSFPVPAAPKPGRAGAADRAYDENVPSTSGSAVVAVLPLIVVLSMTAVPMMAMPPPMPTLKVSTEPLLPGVALPEMPPGVPAAPSVALPARPALPAEPALAWLVVMTSVALACFDPFFAPAGA